MSRILAIDYGKKRTGLAVTDSLQIIANSLTTVNTAELFTFLTDYFAKENVEQVVVGEPRQNNGAPSENYQRVKQFAKRFQQLFPDKEIVFYDERFTSVLAHKTMLEGGLKKKDRSNKALVDAISATIILQDYLNSKHKH